MFLTSGDSQPGESALGGGVPETGRRPQKGHHHQAILNPTRTAYQYNGVGPPGKCGNENNKMNKGTPGTVNNPSINGGGRSLIPGESEAIKEGTSVAPANKS